MQRVQDGALPGTVCTEQEGDGAKVELYWVANALEVFAGDAGDHVTSSFLLSSTRRRHPAYGPNR